MEIELTEYDLGHIREGEFGRWAKYAHEEIPKRMPGVAVSSEYGTGREMAICGGSEETRDELRWLVGQLWKEWCELCSDD